jgi:uncharacterized protein YndB with AHSA1/START domain
MMTKTVSESGTADREIVTTRLIDAPRALVWKVWTDPNHVGNWWGPDGFTNTTLEMDVRPGGVWRFVMHGPDGTDYPNRIDFHEVVPPERLTFAHGDDDGGAGFESSVRFDDQGGKTLITMRALFKTAEERAYVVREHGAIEGAKQTLAKLEEYLRTVPR